VICGDALAWAEKLAKRGDGDEDELFDIVILDPPSTFTIKNKKSTKSSKSTTRWSAVKDYPGLAAVASKCVKPGGALWTTTNCRKVRRAVRVEKKRKQTRRSKQRWWSSESFIVLYVYHKYCNSCVSNFELTLLTIIITPLITLRICFP
jgi:23S rRNA G2069 N7-methylase RlmK/C1962 C5-methylase RlmI